MIDHMSTYATDFEATKTFYEAALPILGYTKQVEMVASWDEEFPERKLCAFGPEGKPAFWLIEVKEAASPRHFAFSAGNHEQVKQFHAAGLETGAKDHGQPGLRPEYHEHYFGSFLIDPDGNNVEAVCHLPE